VKKTRSRPLGRSLSLYFSLVAVIPLAVIAAMVLSHLSGTAAGDVAEKNMLLARAVGGQVEGFLREPLAALQNIRGTIRSDGNMSDRAVEDLLDAHVRNSEIFESIYVLGLEGRVRNVGLSESKEEFKKDYLGLDLSHKDFYRKALQSGKVTWSDTFLSLLSGKMSLAICLVVDERVLVGNINIDILSTFTERLKTGDRVVTTIVDRRGDVIVHPDQVIAARQVNIRTLEPVVYGLAGREGTHRYTFRDEELIGSVALISGPGWLALVSQRIVDVYGPIRHTAMIFILGFMAAILLAVLISVVMARWVSRPLAEFASRARVVAEGSYEFSLPVSGYFEIEELAAGFRSMTRAIGDRERRLVESEEKYRLLVENASDAIFVVQDTLFAFANPQTEKMTGCRAEELAEIPFADFIHPEERERVMEDFRRRIEGEVLSGTYPFRIVDRRGRESWVLLNAIGIDWEGRPATLNFVRDITEQKMFELQALQAQKLEAVGTLAGGIAHDFNNLLQTVQGYAELCLMRSGGDPTMREDLQQISEAAQRGGELTRQLLLFSRKGESRMRPLDVNGEVEKTVKVLKRTLTSMIEVETRLEPRAMMVNGDPSQIDQVLMNLAVNARDAMPGGGRLTIGTAAVRLGKKSGECPGVEEGDYVLLSVSDTGHGVDDETLEHIFEPFFTTKEAGRGTGLGLAMVYGIVGNHEGCITCFSPPGEGATFRVWLPLLAQGEALPGEGEEEEPVGGSETVLLVDDERPLRDLGEKVLTSFGYTVLTASGCREALETFRKEGERIDLVILDMIMPGLGGKECLRQLLERDPGARVLLSTGFSGRDSEEEIVALGGRGLIHKPYTVNVLLREVRSVLDGEGP